MGIWTSERLTRGGSARVGVVAGFGAGVAVGAETGLAVTGGWTASTDADREWAATWPAAGEVARASQGASTAIRATAKEMAVASTKRFPGRWVTSKPYVPKLAIG
jgi:hypothetical protein